MGPTGTAGQVTQHVLEQHVLEQHVLEQGLQGHMNRSMEPRLLQARVRDRACPGAGAGRGACLGAGVCDEGRDALQLGRVGHGLPWSRGGPCHGHALV
jgi:hypothetical protein